MRYNKTDPFYLTKEWRRLRKVVLSKHKSECQYCKDRGIYTKATHVHHDFHRDKYPKYELLEYVIMPDGSRPHKTFLTCEF